MWNMGDYLIANYDVSMVGRSDFQKFVFWRHNWGF